MGAMIVIPARAGSSRFPGKPLSVLRGISLVERTWIIARAVLGVTRVVVATDDDSIFKHVQGFGGEAMMTPDAANGCERTAWVAGALNFTGDVVVNLQGDAVLTPVAAVQAVVDTVRGTSKQPPCEAATAAVPLSHGQFDDYLHHKAQGQTSGTTVVCDRSGRALYFSKLTLPHRRHPRAADEPQAWRHLGLYGFTPAALARYAALEPTVLELTEGLEQLRWLEHGHAMQVARLPALNHAVWSIDYPADLAIADAILQGQMGAS